MSATQDTANVALFGSLASDWWDPEGQSRLLHRINPARLGFIREALVDHFGLDSRARYALGGLAALDIGCGAGLVAEPLARMGAKVEGIDAGDEVISVARAHAEGQGLSITYHVGDVLAFAESNAGCFDFITCLEVVEHVLDLQSFMNAISRLLKPGGLLIYSTPNRTPRSWAVLIAGAEKIARLIPEGGHKWSQFLKPEELAQKLASAGLRPDRLAGLSWRPSKGFHVSEDQSVNFIGTAQKP